MNFDFHAPDGSVYIKYSDPEKVSVGPSGIHVINELKNKPIYAEVHSVGSDVTSVSPGETIVAERGSAFRVADGIFCLKEEDILFVDDKNTTMP